MTKSINQHTAVLDTLFSAENEAIFLEDAISDYFEFVHVVDATASTYKQSLKVFLQHAGNISILAIDRRVMQGFVKSLAKERKLYAAHGNRPTKTGTFSPSTQNKHWGHVKIFINWLLDEELIHKNPLRKIKPPVIPAQPPKSIDPRDFKAMIRAAETYHAPNCPIKDRNLFHLRNVAILMFMGSTACRSEGVRDTLISQITWEDDGAKVWVWEKGKNNQKKGRYVFLYEGATIALMEWLDVHPDPRPNKTIFCCINKLKRGKPMKARTLYKTLDRLALAAGVTGRRNPHGARHMTILEWLKRVPDLSKISQMAGHSDVRVTERNYARWASRELFASHQQTDWL